jgi:hypothetical protein
MPLRDRLVRLIAAVTGTSARTEDLEPRHVRRERARERHEATGEPIWPAAERHENRDGSREVQDVAPGTPGAGASRRRTRWGGG